MCVPPKTTTSSAALQAALAAEPPPPPPPTRSQPARLASWAQRHLAHGRAALPPAPRVARGGRRLRRRGGRREVRGAGEKYGCAAFASLDEAVDAWTRGGERIQGVWVCAPTAAHAALIERAARAGAHVACEKPVGLSAAEIARAYDVCRDCDVGLHCLFQRRSDASYKALLDRLPAEGAPRTIRCVFRDHPTPPRGVPRVLRRRRLPRPRDARPRLRARRPEKGDRRRRRPARAGRGLRRRVGRGVRGRHHGDVAGPGRRRHLRGRAGLGVRLRPTLRGLDGDGRGAERREPRRHVPRGRRRRGRRFQSARRVLPRRLPRGFCRGRRAFARACRGGAAPKVRRGDAVHGHAVAEAARRSAACGRPVALKNPAGSADPRTSSSSRGTCCRHRQF